MKPYLTEYVQRMRKDFSGLDPETAHQIAFAFLSFKLGLYEDAIERCTKALDQSASRPVLTVIQKALRIVRQRAIDLSQSRVRSSALPEYGPDERPFLPIDLPAQSVEDMATLRVHNSLIILYTAGLVGSPPDAQALEEQERYVIQLYAPYRELLEA